MNSVQEAMHIPKVQHRPESAEPRRIRDCKYRNKVGQLNIRVALLSLTVVMIIIGCTSDVESQVEASVEARMKYEIQQLQLKQQRDLLDEKFCIGSTKEQVRAIQGEPKAVLEIGTGPGSAERWTYENFSGISMVTISNDTDRVMHWQDDEGKLKVTTLPELCISSQ